jgi:uncharacterized short protein YbdD (DUF466 family)
MRDEARGWMGGRAAGPWHRLRGWVAGSAPLLRRIAGMPDYDAHLEHLRRCHPDRPLPSRREFFDAYVATRYGDGPTRCC